MRREKVQPRPGELTPSQALARPVKKGLLPQPERPEILERKEKKDE